MASTQSALEYELNRNLAVHTPQNGAGHFVPQHESPDAGSDIAESIDHRPRSTLRIFAIMTALFLSLFIAALDATIVSTAIPTITAQLHSASGYTWIGGAYLLAVASSGPIWAKLSDIFGRKPILLVAVALFMASSVVCALAKNMAMLVVGRTIQGAAGGGLMLLVNIVISDLFSMRKRSLYLGMCEFVWATAGGLGPILGGALTQYVSWRWCWWINLPVAGLAFILLLSFLNVHNPRTSLVDGARAIDWWGSMSMLGLVLMVLLGLDFGGETFPWNSPKVICLIVFGAIMSVFFIYSEKRLAKHPLVPLELFKKRTNVASLLVGFVHGFVFLAGEYYLPLYFQSVKEASPLRSGVLSLPIVITTGFTGAATGIFIHTSGRYREPMWLGMVLLTTGFGTYIQLGVNSPISQLMGFQILAGLGSGMLFEPPLIAIQAMVSQDDTATATSTQTFVRGIAQAFSIVIGGVVFQNSMQGRSSVLRRAGLPSNVTEAFTGKNAAANVILLHALADHPAQQLAVKEAFAWSLRNMWIMYTCVGFLGVVASFFVAKSYLVEEHTETVTGLKKSGNM